MTRASVPRAAIVSARSMRTPHAFSGSVRLPPVEVSTAKLATHITYAVSPTR